MGHFAHCSNFSSPLRARKNTTQLAKYPHVLYVKPSNKVYYIYFFIKDEKSSKFDLQIIEYLIFFHAMVVNVCEI